MEDLLDEFKSHDEFLFALQQRPENLKVFARMLDKPKRGWDPEIFGPFPRDGVLLLYTKLPSSQRSIRSE